jgi:hypothetical protein
MPGHRKGEANEVQEACAPCAISWKIFKPVFFGCSEIAGLRADLKCKMQEIALSS